MEREISAPARAPEDPADAAERRRRVRRSAILFAVIAAAFYFGFIALMLVRGSK
jgi:hypothetical protein